MLSNLYRSDGYILFLLLIMMQIVMMISMSVLIMIIRYGVINDQQLQKADYHYDLLSILELLGKTAAQSQNCRINNTPPAYLSSASITWWKANTCSGNFKKIRYYYAFEDLGVYPCAKVNIGVRPQLAHYMRLSIYFSFDHFRGRSVWQATWVYPDYGAETCEREQMSIINAGMQTIHELV